MEHHELGRVAEPKNLSAKRKEEPTCYLPVPGLTPLPLCPHWLPDKSWASSRTFPQGMGNW